ncbi:hypothetical protein P43SY_009281 [Pythium insidiosum]|uniref:Uncharacterized protein n=1 Tax=Pythium insidiosum TaxID=114742 RepID=A0AAD5LXZ2_PYTIN|nr:hypothetical protein P43SY_009281 [Pythium insidiosum]
MAVQELEAHRHQTESESLRVEVEYFDDGLEDFEIQEMAEALQHQQLLHLLEEERQLLSLMPVGTVDATWKATFTLEDWKLLQQKVSTLDRRALSVGWTTLGTMALRTTQNATHSLNCLRRAIAWHPGYVPAFLDASALLRHMGFENASCTTMEKMLEHIDPTEFRSGEMRAILTSHFSHCSIVIRMAHLWEHHPIVRYIVAISVIISFLHGVFPS